MRSQLESSGKRSITRLGAKDRLNYRRIRAMLQEAEFVVAHNAAFDRGFVERLMPSARKKKWLCSMKGINWKAKGFPSRSLPALASAHAILNPQTHHASGDAATLLALLSTSGRRRKSYLFELLRNAGVVRRQAGGAR